jgi:lipopolysaccharide transport system ATP-binding protein
MPEAVIRVEKLSKEYVLGKNGGSDGLRHMIHDYATAPFRWLKKPEHGARHPQIKGRKPAESFWALKDVSFDIKQGEVVGIIGRNGAGKSTLLKILSRITEPTEGRVEITGRVASLLEVGTGFHPELTGRENIFLNGAILGMSRSEIKKKFDEIVAFSEVEKFLDTPVKRYSSGMYVRLAFAVAAHLEPEILIVDEVLAVGDAQFQKKCLGKMQDVASGGRTILFVSHNMDAVLGLCSRTILIGRGQVHFDGDTKTAVSKYIKIGSCTIAAGQHLELNEAARSGSGRARFKRLQIMPTVGNNFHPMGGIKFIMTLAADVETTIESLAVALFSDRDWKLINLDTINKGIVILLGDKPKTVTFTIDDLPLTPGSYRIMLWMSNPSSGEVIDHIESAAELIIEPSIETGSTSYAGRGGALHIDFKIGHTVNS